MELLIITDAFRHASAGRITAVMPYFGYARQDRKAKAHDPISAKLVANIITRAGADRVLTMDLHAPQLQGFFDIPVDHLSGVPILAPYFIDKFGSCIDNVTVVSPDLGSVNRARAFSQICGTPIAIIDKKRPRPGESEVCNIIGDVQGKICILVDDMIDTAGTICNAAKALTENGKAKSVYACATHGVLSGGAVERLDKSSIEETVLLDTIEIPPQKLADKFKILPTESVFAETIERIHENLPVSTIFK
jgi:ribose-phosphate pyrophosphokinase